MKTLTVALLLCAMMVLSEAAVEKKLVKRSFFCPSDWTLINGRCFQYVSREMTWATAERHCRTIGANLASVHSHEEYNEIRRLTARYGSKLAWIGGSDAQEENIWFWSDGTPFLYSDWCPGEPNNIHIQHCLQMNYGGDKCWDDQKCSVLLPSVCVKRFW